MQKYLDTWSDCNSSCWAHQRVSFTLISYNCSVLLKCFSVAVPAGVRCIHDHFKMLKMWLKVCMFFISAPAVLRLCLSVQLLMDLSHIWSSKRLKRSSKRYLTTSFTYNRILIYGRTCVKPDGNILASIISLVLLIETDVTALNFAVSEIFLCCAMILNYFVSASSYLQKGISAKASLEHMWGAC